MHEQDAYGLMRGRADAVVEAGNIPEPRARIRPIHAESLQHRNFMLSHDTPSDLICFFTYKDKNIILSILEVSNGRLPDRHSRLRASLAQAC